jgi:hypothetical protein
MAPMADILQSLQRLERAGTDRTEAVKELKCACHELAQRITELVPHDVELPRGYRVNNDLSRPRLEKMTPDGILMMTRSSWDRACRTPAHEAALTLAEDVASGWIEELIDLLDYSCNLDTMAAVRLSCAHLQLECRN